MKKILFGILVLAFLFLISNADAWGVGSIHTRDNPLVLAPNATTTMAFDLQNLAGDQDLRIKVTLLNGTEYAQLLGPDEYDLPFGSKDVKVNFRITAPSLEGAYYVSASFATITSGAGQGVVMGQEIVREFYLISSLGEPEEEVEEGLQWWVYLIAVVVVLAIVLMLVLKPRKKKFEKKLEKKKGK